MAGLAVKILCPILGKGPEGSGVSNPFDVTLWPYNPTNERVTDEL